MMKDLTQSEIMNIGFSGECTTHEEEPWFARGNNQEGRKPPFFAEYTQVSYGDNTCIHTLFKNLRMATIATRSHYLWVDTNKKKVEIWAHPEKISFAVKYITLLIKACMAVPFKQSYNHPGNRRHFLPHNQPYRPGFRNNRQTVFDLSEFLVTK